jgi:hypothetical protein
MNNIKQVALIFLSFLSVNSYMTSANARRLNWTDADFEGYRVIADTAWKTKEEAQQRGEFLNSRYRYQNIGVLWIPFYKNLSSKRLYQTIIVPNENCDSFLRKNANRVDRGAYCFTPSNEGIRANRKGIRN